MGFVDSHCTHSVFSADTNRDHLVQKLDAFHSILHLLGSNNLYIKELCSQLLEQCLISGREKPSVSPLLMALYSGQSKAIAGHKNGTARGGIAVGRL